MLHLQHHRYFLYFDLANGSDHGLDLASERLRGSNYGL